MKTQKPSTEIKTWRIKLYEIIFEADTHAGKFFDVMLIWAILASVTVVFLESINALKVDYGEWFIILEWVFTILFTIEYVLRIICVRKPFRYIFSFFGVVDFLAIVPTYLSLLIAGSQYLLVIRILRLLRVFRVFKLTHLVKQSDVLVKALKASRAKIAVFLFAVVTLVVIIGALMYVIEGPENGFTSIPVSMYWAIVTLTTVGYGDISPQSPIGQLLASMVMVMGYGIIAVPTGIVSVEIASATKKQITTQVCPSCLSEGHDIDAVHCKFCGAKL
ncbi:MAG: ion transporter [Ignavibacteriaceae bacterium]|nr:ion transporter [Ignavibacteriaceae bacterium]